MSSSLPEIKTLAVLFPSDPRGLEYTIAYVYAGVTLLAFAEEKKIPALWQQIANAHSSSDEAQTTAARRLREGLLKASPLVGFPRSINGLAALHTAIQQSSPSVAGVVEQDHSMREPVPKAVRQQRGKDFFNKIYAQHADRVLHSMNMSSGGDLGEFAVTCIYGDLMAEERILNAKESGLMEFVACYAGMAAPQAKGHMYGARNLGNSGKEISAAVALVDRIAESMSARFSTEGMEFVEKVKEW